jgi:hypothetical protein
MDNPRILILNRIRQNKHGIIIDELEYNNDRCILSTVIDSIYYTIIDYIKLERKIYTVGKLELEYTYTDSFHNCEDPKQYLEKHRELDDIGLMMYVYDNYNRMNSSKHRRLMFYFMNILYFDL